MANVKVQWTLPDTRESGRALPLSEIARVNIAVSADAVSFADIGSFPPDVLETVVEALDTGEWLFRGIVVDTRGKQSAPLFGSIVVDESAPGALKSLTVVLQ